MLLKRSQFLALAAGALVTPLVASCGKSAAPSGPVDIDPKGEIKPREIRSVGSGGHRSQGGDQAP